MVNRKRAVAALAAVLITVAGVSSTYAWTWVNYLTFSGTVALPGVTLPAGSYTFEVLTPAGPGDVVRVSSRQGQHVFLGMTRGVERPRGLRREHVVTFGEAPAGAPPPIAVWYPIGESKGHEFVYPGRR